MARHRFKEVMQFLRFDMKNTWSRRLRTDKFAHISEVWEIFIGNCKDSYTPHENITIDKQLFPTKCRCPFTQYLENNPDKVWIKFWFAADVVSRYLLNEIPYLGKDDVRSAKQPLSAYVVLRFMDPFNE